MPRLVNVPGQAAKRGADRTFTQILHAGSFEPGSFEQQGGASSDDDDDVAVSAALAAALQRPQFAAKTSLGGSAATSTRKSPHQSGGLARLQATKKTKASGRAVRVPVPQNNEEENVENNSSDSQDGFVRKRKGAKQKRNARQKERKGQSGKASRLLGQIYTEAGAINYRNEVNSSRKEDGSELSVSSEDMPSAKRRAAAKKFRGGSTPAHIRDGSSLSSDTEVAEKGARVAHGGAVAKRELVKRSRLVHLQTEKPAAKPRTLRAPVLAPTSDAEEVEDAIEVSSDDHHEDVDSEKEETKALAGKATKVKKARVSKKQLVAQHRQAVLEAMQAERQAVHDHAESIRAAAPRFPILKGLGRIAVHATMPVHGVEVDLPGLVARCGRQLEKQAKEAQAKDSIIPSVALLQLSSAGVGAGAGHPVSRSALRGSTDMDSFVSGKMYETQAEQRQVQQQPELSLGHVRVSLSSFFSSCPGGTDAVILMSEPDVKWMQELSYVKNGTIGGVRVEHGHSTGHATGGLVPLQFAAAVALQPGETVAPSFLAVHSSSVEGEALGTAGGAHSAPSPQVLTRRIDKLEQKAGPALSSAGATTGRGRGTGGVAFDPSILEEAQLLYSQSQALNSASASSPARPSAVGQALAGATQTYCFQLRAVDVSRRLLLYVLMQPGAGAASINSNGASLAKAFATDVTAALSHRASAVTVQLQAAGILQGILEKSQGNPKKKVPGAGQAQRKAAKEQTVADDKDFSNSTQETSRADVLSLPPMASSGVGFRDIAERLRARPPPVPLALSAATSTSAASSWSSLRPVLAKDLPHEGDGKAGAVDGTEAVDALVRAARGVGVRVEVDRGAAPIQVSIGEGSQGGYHGQAVASSSQPLSQSQEPSAVASFFAKRRARGVPGVYSGANSASANSRSRAEEMLQKEGHVQENTGTGQGWGGEEDVGVQGYDIPAPAVIAPPPPPQPKVNAMKVRSPVFRIADIAFQGSKYDAQEGHARGAASNSGQGGPLKRIKLQFDSQEEL